ncbi:hypothetical protein EDB89DRAFT_2152512 [Lactarius sanguifluus]|nr:hypothetical protein EDB89DRAFT_2152512 [Lactarius sanguifluus]
MEQCPYLGGEDQDSLLPPLSPPIIGPSSPLTVLDESEDHPPTMHASSRSPLSSPMESPTLAPIPPLCFLARHSEASGSAHTKQAQEEKQKSRTAAFKECLDILSTNELTFAELTEYVFFHDDQTPEWRHENFFVNRGLVTHLLDYFASSKVKRTSQKDVRGWAKSTVLQTIKKEVNMATQSGDLRITEREIDSSFVSGLSFEELKAMVQRHCPIFLRLLVGAITTSWQIGSASKVQLAAKDHAAAFIILNLLGACSQKNSYTRHVMGLYLYSTGATRQQISVINHLGLSVSYAANLLTSKLATSSNTGPGVYRHKHCLGTLEALSESMRKVTCKVAASGLYVLVYDNINMVWKVAEQILGHTNSMENGTCATIVSLFWASVEDLRATELERRFGSAPELKVSDIVLTKDEYTLHRKCLIHTVLQIADLQAMEPHSGFRIDVHKSEIHPLPAMNINEASTMGNAEVVDAVMEELNMLVARDQLSIMRLRAILAARAGNEGGASSLRWALFIPGLFHCKIATTNGFLQTHFGHTNHDLKDPASLASHNTLLGHLLQRKPIILSSLPPFRTCRDLIFVSLYARVLHCLLKVSGAQSLESFSNGLTWLMLCGHAEAVVDAFTDARMVDNLRCSRCQERGRLPGDMIFENAMLFLRDGLILQEFSDAIKSGDSSRSGCSKYAYEVLHLLHNVTHVWLEPVVRIVLNNWLVNPTGKANSFVKLDLMQEHLNYWIKNYYQAHGSGASWEWLTTISPCIEILRRLATEVNNTLGSKQGNRHASADLTKDIKILMDSLKQNNIYKEVLGHTLGDDESPAPDVIGEGYSMLTWGAKSPLRQFNRLISTLQRCSAIQPLVGTSEDNGLAHNDPEDPEGPDNDELELGPNEEMEQSLNDTQPALSLQTADDIDLEMDVDLQERVEALDEGDGTDNSDDDGDNSDFFC